MKREIISALRVKGSELRFISRLKRDGSGVEKRAITKRLIYLLKNEDFTLLRLSLTEDTYIAHGFNSYIVRLKNKE